MITVTLSGDPQGKGRARAFRRGSFIGHYTPEKTRTYEGMIRTAAMDAMGDNEVIPGPVKFVLTAIFSVPASWSRKKREMALAGQLLPTKKPDLDNIVKAWTDAMNGVVFADDCQIVHVSSSKSYGNTPAVIVTVKPLAQEAAMDSAA
ncbi:RusA family crossover junction endodeoxyribonuclease [Bradyrhizobium sp. Tv2a-2]|uniref:RusA family crossover junction endodeoxyribonuclease n=1 Tax=Bradyrhizobium sp. Tv2a-2 TaxID=113395 RepID=UPI000465F1FD|nr:RusA family crossover junction endodeoxyribonuclease [Bradyrhizobium sp. Tv2a-2]